MTQFDHTQDGVTHICVAPQAQTDLGRLLYIGAHRPFTDPEYGYFASVIAFWIWYDSGKMDSLREIHQDNMIRSSLSGLQDRPGNREAVGHVLRRSILQDPVLSQMVKDSTLPFVAYETIRYAGRQDPVTYDLKDRQWYVDALESIRAELQAS